MTSIALPSPERLAAVLWSLSRQSGSPAVRFVACENALRAIVLGGVVRTSASRAEYRRAALRELERLHGLAAGSAPGGRP